MCLTVWPWESHLSFWAFVSLLVRWGGNNVAGRDHVTDIVNYQWRSCALKLWFSTLNAHWAHCETPETMEARIPPPRDVLTEQFQVAQAQRGLKIHRDFHARLRITVLKAAPREDMAKIPIIFEGPFFSHRGLWTCAAGELLVIGWRGTRGH